MGKRMDRAIMFRGKNPILGNWVYGYLIRAEYEGDFIKTFGTNETISIIDGTMGQFTGLKDKNKKDIYEGDIVQEANDGIITTGLVSIEYGNTYINYGNFGKYVLSERCYDLIEVIGNIYENPELISKGVT